MQLIVKSQTKNALYPAFSGILLIDYKSNIIYHKGFCGLTLYRMPYFIF